MSLLALQRDFRAWLATESVEAGARLEGGRAAGLPIYLNNYRASLMACLNGSFETTRAWLGEEAFAAAAADHIDRAPPRSWTLDAYAYDFPETLEGRYPDDPEVGDLARLERALGIAFVGPDADPIDFAALAEVDWDTSSLRFLPTLELLTVTSNACAIWSAITAGEPPPSAERAPAPALVAVWRSGLAPAFRTLDDDEAEALQAMTSGRRFADLCADLVGRRGGEQGLAMAGALLGRWLRDGLISAVAGGSGA